MRIYPVRNLGPPRSRIYLVLGTLQVARAFDALRQALAANGAIKFSCVIVFAPRPAFSVGVVEGNEKPVVSHPARLVRQHKLERTLLAFRQIDAAQCSALVLWFTVRPVRESYEATLRVKDPRSTDCIQAGGAPAPRIPHGASLPFGYSRH